MALLGRKQALGQGLIGTQLVAILDFLDGLEVVVALVVVSNNLLELVDAALDIEDFLLWSILSLITPGPSTLEVWRSR